MTDSIDTLRPEVKLAIEWLQRFVVCNPVSSIETWKEYSELASGIVETVRAELLRLAEYEQAAGQLAIEKAEFRQRAEQYEAELASIPDADEWDALRERAEKAEAELAALKARIAESAHIDVTLGCAIDGEIPPDLALCKVALVKVEE